MQYLLEQSKNYSDLDTLRQDLALMDVKESKPFRLDQMCLTTQGAVQVKGLGEFLLSDIALFDAIRRGGIQIPSSQNFFDEQNSILDAAILNAVNLFYKHSSHANAEIKLVTKANESGQQRIVLGIPSKYYTLFTHAQAVDKISHSLSKNLELKRANLHPTFMELAFTDPLTTVKDTIGSIVEIGSVFYNSQGTRTRSLTVSAFALRLICTNGSVGSTKLFSTRYIHKGDLNKHNSKFAKETTRIFERFSSMMQRLPILGNITVTDKLIAKIRPTLIETLKTKEAEEFIKGINNETKTVMDVWNKVTSLPQQIQNPITRVKLEQLGFKILTLNLSYN